MQFIDNYELAVAKVRCVIFLREHDRQTLRCRDKEIRAFFTELGPARLCRVACARMDRQFVIEAHASNRGAQVFLDIVSKRSQRRDVNARSEEHTSELQSHSDLVCRLLLEKKKT